MNLYTSESPGASTATAVIGPDIALEPAPVHKSPAGRRAEPLKRFASECQLHSKLDLTGRSRAGNDACLRRVYVGIRKIEVGMIEDVEELGPEHQANAFSDWKRFEHGKIEVYEV